VQPWPAKNILLSEVVAASVIELRTLKMSTQKNHQASRIACTGSEKWKRMVTWCAIKHGIFVQFTDPEMQGAFYQEQLLANPLQLRAVRLHSIEARLRTEETEDLIFTPTRRELPNWSRHGAGILGRTPQ
jgi:hypothetical protein